MTRENQRQAIYVLLVGGIPLLAFQATSQSEAASLVKEDWLHEDLRTARSGGKPLWNGVARLSVRRATETETAEYTKHAKPSTNGSGDLVIVYLVEVDT